jgi:hypothetical protein
MQYKQTNSLIQICLHRKKPCKAKGYCIPFTPHISLLTAPKPSIFAPFTPPLKSISKIFIENQPLAQVR